MVSDGLCSTHKTPSRIGLGDALMPALHQFMRFVVHLCIHVTDQAARV